MDTAYGMSPQSYRSYNHWHWIIGLVLLALLCLLPLFGIGPNAWRDCLPGVSPSALTAPAAPAVAPVAAPDVTSPPPVAAAPAEAPVESPATEITPPAPVARVFFPLNQYQLPGDADRALADVVSYLKANPGTRAMISGFHDAHGAAGVEYNQLLALNRARAVREALQRKGISPESIIMNKPQETTGSGSNDEARRVDVTVQP